MFQRVHFHEFLEVIEAHAAARPAMNGKRHVVLFGGLEDRPVVLVTIGFAEIGLRRQHHRREPHPFGGTARDFNRRGFGILDRHDARAIEPFVL